MRTIDRLIQYMQLRKITAYSLEKNCKVANGYLKKQQKGKGSIGSDILERIHANYFDLNLEWLLTGKGKMLNDESDDLSLHMVREERQTYNKDEIIASLSKRIALLEAALADKEKIIRLLEGNTSKG